MSLGIAITGLRKLQPDPFEFEQGGVEYGCELFQVTSYESLLWVAEPLLYDENGHHNLLGKQIGRMSLSPITQYVVDAVGSKDIHLDWANPVQ
ncbi:MAG: hypothetical protein WDN27_01005 [Candidatus Saccharibacteria bacterium]